MCDPMLWRGGHRVLTSKDKASPQKDNVPSGVVEVSSREEGGHRSCQNANGAQLESSEDVHVDHAVIVRCGKHDAVKSSNCRKNERCRETGIPEPFCFPGEDAGGDEAIVSFARKR
jgi:hypothetical protein